MVYLHVLLGHFCAIYNDAVDEALLNALAYEKKNHPTKLTHPSMLSSEQHLKKTKLQT
jgi:hypothetical protein